MQKIFLNTILYFFHLFTICLLFTISAFLLYKLMILLGIYHLSRLCVWWWINFYFFFIALFTHSYTKKKTCIEIFLILYTKYLYIQRTHTHTTPRLKGNANAHNIHTCVCVCVNVIFVHCSSLAHLFIICFLL